MLSLNRVKELIRDETLSDDKIQLVLTAAKSHNREFEPEELHQLLFYGINHG